MTQEHRPVDVAEKVEREREAPVEGAAELLPRAFPPLVLWTLPAGVALGTLAGVRFAKLLLDGVLTVPGWEQLFSLVPYSFYAFWAFMGAAAGIFASAVAVAVLPAEGRDEAEPTARRRESREPERTAKPPTAGVGEREISREATEQAAGVGPGPSQASEERERSDADDARDA